MAIRIFRHYWQLHLVLLAIADLAICFFSQYFVLGFTEQSIGSAASGRPHSMALAAIFAACVFLSLVAMALFSARQRTSLLGVIIRLLLAVAVGTLIYDLLFIGIFFKRVPSIIQLISFTLTFGGCILVHAVISRMVNEDMLKRKVLIYGAGQRAASIARLRRRSDRRGFVIVGYVPAGEDEPVPEIGSHLLVKQGPLRDCCRELGIDEIVVAMDDRRRHFPMDELLDCRLDGVEATELITFLERETGKLRLDVLNPSWMIFSDGFRRGRLHTVFERALDILASLVLTIATLPVMLLTIICIKLEDGIGASIFYGQKRVGQYGKVFRVLKFRSMREDAEKNGAPQWATKNDTRVTSIGSFIRKTRIDELPQVLNVLRGEMSFVGPRPERPEFVAQLAEKIPYYRERHNVKPGITGWAQLCYPYGSSEQDALEKLQYDLYYVKNHTLFFYLVILIQTVEVIIWRKGAR